MSKNRRTYSGTYAVVLIFASLLCLIFFVTDTIQKRFEILHFNESPHHDLSSEGVEEDRGGRKAFEVLRHQNPVTGLIPPYARQQEGVLLKRFLKDQARTRRESHAGFPAWKCIGPYNLGGRTKALALDASDPQQKTILAGCVTGGMWRSEDLGATWTRTTAASQLSTVSCLAQDKRPGHEQTWYFGTGEIFDVSDPDNDNGLLRGNGIYKSVDGGKSWQVLPSTAAGDGNTYDNPFDYVWDVAVDLSNSSEDEIYAATISGIFRSVDGGSTWEKVLGLSGDAGRYTDLVITTEGVVYVSISNIDGRGLQSGIFRSGDGVHWEKINPSWWPGQFNRTVLAVCPGNEKRLYALTDLSTRSGKKHLLCTYLEGAGWEDRSANLPDFDYDLGDFDSQLSFAMALAVKPDDENVVFLGGVNLYRSTDGFRSAENTRWIGGYDPRKTDMSKYPVHHPDQHALVFFNDPRKMLSGHDGGVSLLENDLSLFAEWKNLNNGYVTSQFYTIAVNHATDDGVVVGGMQDNGSFYDIGAHGSWASLLTGDGAYCAISNNGHHYYASSQFGRIYRLDYFHNEYTGFARVDPPQKLNYLFINPFVLDPYNSSLLYMAGGDYIWRNENAPMIPPGSDEATMDYWKKLTMTRVNGTITALGISTVPGNILYYGTSKGRLFRLEHADTEMPVVREITGNVFPKYLENPIGYISSVAVDPFDAKRIMVTFSNYEVMSVYFSADGGETWEAVAGNLEARSDGSGAGPAVYSAAMLHRQDGTLYLLGTSAGLFYTDSLAGMQTTWQWEEAIGNIPVEMIVCRQKDGTVLAATHGYGVHAARFTDAVAPEFQPLTFSVGQGYPNPVRQGQEFLVPVSLDEDMLLQMSLVDASGKMVRTLLNEEMTGGKHVVELSSSGLEPGVYYLVTNTGFHRKTVSRMVVR